MAYLFYLGKTLLPIAPGKLHLKINNQNKTMNLINDSEVNVLNKPGLTDVEFEVLLPNFKYPFATYKSGFQKASVFLNSLKTLKVSQQPFQFIVTREFPTGASLFGTNMKVSLESYEIKEDSKQGFDVVVSIKLKQYRDYGTKVCQIIQTEAAPQAVVQQERETAQSPAPKATTTYTVAKGDCLWHIAKKLYGDGSKYTTIVGANTDKVTNPNLIYPGQVLTIPAL